MDRDGSRLMHLISKMPVSNDMNVMTFRRMMAEQEQKRWQRAVLRGEAEKSKQDKEKQGKLHRRFGDIVDQEKAENLARKFMEVSGAKRQKQKSTSSNPSANQMAEASQDSQQLPE
jgi:hypothetical protein